MSLILDALRRGQTQPDPEAREPSQVTAYADAVLATLGYSCGKPPTTLRTWLRAYGLWPIAVVLLGLGVWTAWWYATGNPGGFLLAQTELRMQEGRRRLSPVPVSSRLPRRRSR